VSNRELPGCDGRAAARQLHNDWGPRHDAGRRPGTSARAIKALFPFAVSASDFVALAEFAHGRGTLRWYSAGKLLETDQGEFKDGRLNGFAVLTFTSGRKFEGNFVDQKPQGQGTLSEANGEVYSGQWSQGCFNDRGRQATFNTSKQACGFN